MNIQAEPSEEELKTLKSMIKQGRLFEVQEWIAQGRPIFLSDSRKEQVLTLAVETGFHSMVQVLAKTWPDRETLNQAMQRAADRRRPDLVWLLLGHGAQMNAVYLESIAQCYDRDLMRHYLDHWAELDQPDKLLQIVTARVYPLIGLIHEHAPRIPNYDLEIGRALKHFIDEGDAKWVSLSLWLGADPRKPVPGENWKPEDDEWQKDWSTPLEDALWRHRLDIVKLMKISPEKDDLNTLLSRVQPTRDEGMDVAEYLVKLGAEINNKPNGGSSVLDGLLGKWDFMRRWGMQGYYGSLIDEWTAKDWIRRGARFVPDSSDDLRTVREGLCGLSREGALDFLRLLARTTSSETLAKLINTPKIRSHIGLTPKQFLEDLEPKRQRKQIITAPRQSKTKAP